MNGIQKAKLCHILLIMAFLFITVVALFPIISFVFAQIPGGSELVLNTLSYRIPLLAALCSLPTLIYVNTDPVREIKLTIRGLVHAITTIGIILMTFYFFGWPLRENVWLYLIIVFIIYAICRTSAFLGYCYYMKSLQRRQRIECELQAKEAEQKALQYYTSEMERQNNAVRKFKHDYQNILLSLDSYIQEKDLDGLETYYATKIKTVSELIIKEEFSLQNLSKIKVTAIKSIFTGKLMLAQNCNIDVMFEADMDIADFFVDSIDLVRIIGILMDNAIEACRELPDGKLLTGCFKDEDGITIIVQNTCRPDIPKVYELLQEGFSTKGEGRGLGLTNLKEIVDAHANLTLETSIVNNNFIQKLRIGRV